VAGALGSLVGPQHTHDPLARDLAFDGQVGEQRGSNGLVEQLDDFPVVNSEGEAAQGPDANLHGSVCRIRALEFVLRNEST
jgi:hypothetical protein